MSALKGVLELIQELSQLLQGLSLIKEVRESRTDMQCAHTYTQASTLFSILVHEALELTICKLQASARLRARVCSFGERMSTTIAVEILKHWGVASNLVESKDFLVSEMAPQVLV